jgi:hypothetical protein
MSYLRVVSSPELLTWQQLDQYMTSGNFGSPPTDDNVRDKLASFKQRKVAGLWHTPRHLGKMLAIIKQAPTRPDDKSLIWFVKGSLHPALRERMQLTPDNKPWSSFPAFCTALREVGVSATKCDTVHPSASWNTRESDGMLLQSVLSPAPLLDWAPDAGPKPVWASRTPGSEPHVRASGPCLGTELGFALPYRHRLI